MFLRILSFSFLILSFCPLLRAQGVQIDAGFSPVIVDNRAPGRFTALQLDGKIIGNDGATRYNADGSLDATYKGAQHGLIRRAAVTADKILLLDNNNTLTLINADGSVGGTISTSVSASTPIIAQPDGKFLVGQSLTLGSVTRLSITRLNHDGTLDPTFDAGLGAGGGGATVSSLSLQPDGRIVAAGFFTSFDGVPTANFARLNSTGTVDRSFAASPNPAAISYSTQAIVLPNGKILAEENTTSTHLIRLNADGSLDAVLGDLVVNNSSFGLVSAFAVQPDGRVLVGGQFSSYAGKTRLNLVRLNADSSFDASFDASAMFADTSPAVLQIAVQPDGRIFFSAFTVPGGDHFVRLNADGSFDPTFTPGPAQLPTSLIVNRHADGRIAVAGAFTTVNGIARAGVARLLVNGSLDPSFNAAAALPITLTALAAQPDGRIVIAGPFAVVNGSLRNGLARFSANGALDPALNPVLSTGATVAALAALPDGRVVIGGNFSSVNGIARGNLAAFLSDGSLDPVFAANAVTNGTVRMIALRPGGGVLIAGSFTTVVDQRRNGLAALAADGSLDQTFVPSQLTASDIINVLAATPDGGAIIGGPTPGSSLRGALRRLMSNGNFDTAFAFGLAVNADFSALAVDAQGRPLAAYTGIETFEGGSDTSHHYLQRFTTAGALDASFSVGIGPSAPLTSIIVVPDGTVLVAGSFRCFDDLPFAAMMRLLPGNPPASSLLFNISTRGETSTGSTLLTVGFVLGGSVAKTILIRATGPSLTTFGVANTLPDPILTLFRADGTVIATNDNWSGFVPLLPRASAPDAGFNVLQTDARVGAFPLQSPLEAVFVATLTPGNYTAQVSAAGGTPSTGIALVEVYDANAFPGNRRLLNISTRGNAGSGSRTLIAGFVVSGTTAKTVLIRAAGPGLAPFNVAGALADPMLTVIDNLGTPVATNDDWGAGANKADIANAAVKAGAFAFPDGSKDSALLLTLAPGNYSAVVNGANGATGIALVEVYEVP